MAGVDDIVGVGVDGVAAGTGASALNTYDLNRGLTTVATHSSSS